MRPKGKNSYKLLKSKQLYLVLALAAGILLFTLSASTAYYNQSRRIAQRDSGSGILVFGNDIDVKAGQLQTTPGTPSPAPSPASSTKSSGTIPLPVPPPPPPSPSPVTHTINYTDTCFSPPNLTIAKGDTINFMNSSSGNMWPASDDHPTHDSYPDFDAKRAIASGSAYSFTFNKSGAWGYHDHLSSDCKGTITVN
jgi:plastocyanin